MSWAAHDLEPYAFQRHLKLKVAFVPLLIGSYSPDMMTKWFVYGIHIGPWDLKAHDPAKFHRGWPGLGFTHSLLYGVVICLIFWKGLGSKNWGVAFLIGQWAHALTDAGDTVGTMLFFPWTFHVHFDAWAYAGQTGRLTDAAAYFSGLGGMWDAVWIVYGLVSWQVLTRSYFETHVFTADWTFVRFHYGSRGRRGNYSERELEEWAQRFENWSGEVEVFAYFNNDWALALSRENFERYVAFARAFRSGSART